MSIEYSSFTEIAQALDRTAIDLATERAARAAAGYSANVLAALDSAIAQLAIARTALGQPFQTSSAGGMLLLSRHIAKRVPPAAGLRWIYPEYPGQHLG